VVDEDAGMHTRPLAATDPPLDEAVIAAAGQHLPARYDTVLLSEQLAQ
jgi:hypothetical protein